MTVRDIVDLEEGASNGWPALGTEAHGGWLYRFANGYSKRANSVHPLYEPAPGDLEERVQAAEAAYGKRGLPPTFKLPGHAAWATLDAFLEHRGYRVVDPSRILVRNLAGPIPAAPGYLSFRVLDDAWLEGFFGANALPRDHQTTARSMVRLVDSPVFGLVESGKTAVAWGYVALSDHQAWVYDVVVAPEARRRGHAQALMNGLLAEALAAGARQACLQVVAANAPANALYEGLGFTETYRYGYRRQERKEGR